MKRILSILCAAALLVCLCACSRTAPAVVSETMETPRPASTPAAEPVPSGADRPVLSEGAASDARLSDLFELAGDGALYTSLVRADGLVCLYDLLPEDIGYIAGFLVTDGGVYAVMLEYYSSLEPAALYFFPSGGGEGELLAENVYPSGSFCLAGESLFYEDYDESVFRLDLTTGETSPVLPAGTRFLAADAGFIYYARAGGIYRNDSTMTAETLLFEADGPRRLFADDNGLYDLTYSDNGSAAILELREPDGTLRAQRELPELTGTIGFRGGRIYVPQIQTQTILVIDAADGEAIGEIPLPMADAYCFIRYMAPDALYYETLLDGTAQICRVGLDGADAQALGEFLIF